MSDLSHLHVWHDFSTPWIAYVWLINSFMKKMIKWMGDILITEEIWLQIFGSLDYPDFLGFLLSDGDSVYSRENSLKILETPVQTCLNVTGTHVKTCLTFWQLLFSDLLCPWWMKEFVRHTYEWVHKSHTFVWHFGSCSYFQSDLLCPWCVTYELIHSYSWSASTTYVWRTNSFIHIPKCMCVTYELIHSFMHIHEVHQRLNETHQTCVSCVTKWLTNSFMCVTYELIHVTSHTYDSPKRDTSDVCLVCHEMTYELIHVTSHTYDSPKRDTSDMCLVCHEMTYELIHVTSHTYDSPKRDTSNMCLVCHAMSAMTHFPCLICFIYMCDMSHVTSHVTCVTWLA